MEVIACRLQFAGLCHKKIGRNDTASTDNIQFVLVEDARRNAAQHELLSFEENGMAGVRTARKTSHDVVSGREDVHNLSLSLVAENDAK